MPTYEYECKSCAHNFEAFQSINEPPLSNCPRCGREVRRLIRGGTGVIFKGSGFYVTDKKAGGSSAGKASPPTPPPAGGEKPAPAPAGESPKTGGEAALSKAGAEAKAAG
jgi:putative FmdB family regulatory protein